MKILIVSLLFGAATASFAQCDAKLAVGDSIGTIQKKLDCLADENKKLKDENKELKDGAASPKSKPASQPMVYISPVFASSHLDVQACMAKATAVFTSHSGSPQPGGPDSVEANVKGTTVYVLCSKQMVIAADPDGDRAYTQSVFYRNEIFSQ